MTRVRLPFLARTAGLLALALLPHGVLAQPVVPKPAADEGVGDRLTDVRAGHTPRMV